MNEKWRHDLNIFNTTKCSFTYIFCFILATATSSASASENALGVHLEKIQILAKDDTLNFQIFWKNKDILKNASVGFVSDDSFFSTPLQYFEFKDHTQWLTDKEKKENMRWLTIIAISKDRKGKVFLQLNLNPKAKFYLEDLLKNYPTERIEL